MIYAMIRLMLLTAVVVVWAAPVLGEYYRYTDSDGVVRFTDDLSRVPSDQRPDVKTYESSLAVTKGSATAPSAPHGGGFAPTAQSDAPSERDLLEAQTFQQAAELDQMQAELNRVFISLKDARADLEAQAPATWAPVKDRDDYRAKVEALNARIERYEAQRGEYSRRVEAFNAQLNRAQGAP